VASLATSTTPDFSSGGNVKIFFVKAYYFSGVNISFVEEHQKLTRSFNQRIKQAFVVVQSFPFILEQTYTNIRNLNY
jgi:hypothetical protein